MTQRKIFDRVLNKLHNSHIINDEVYNDVFLLPEFQSFGKNYFSFSFICEKFIMLLQKLWHYKKFCNKEIIKRDEIIKKLKEEKIDLLNEIKDMEIFE
jgi:hypothetical protein